uniref:Uncharacterized protein n=1 Tax=Brassica campestris TaxID=3711 RepID=A0A3P6BMD7_BRACM|nr:unnamed protein product [Brassica rapa]
MTISPPSSAKTHSLCSMFLLLYFLFSVSSYVLSVLNCPLVCFRRQSAQFFVSSLVSSNPTISHKRYGTEDLFFVSRFGDSLLLPLRFGMALLGCIHKQLTTLHGEQTNEKGEKMYIQTRMAEYAEELWELLEKKRTTPLFTCVVSRVWRRVSMRS